MFAITIDSVDELPDGRINIIFSDGYGVVFSSRDDLNEWASKQNLDDSLRKSAYLVLVAWLLKNNQIRSSTVDDSCTSDLILGMSSNV